MDLSLFLHLKSQPFILKEGFFNKKAHNKIRSVIGRRDYVNSHIPITSGQIKTLFLVPPIQVPLELLLGFMQSHICIASDFEIAKTRQRLISNLLELTTSRLHH